MSLMNIHLLVQEFYSIEAVTTMLSGKQYGNFEPMRHSHSRWHDDFYEFRTEYIDKLASAIFDYTAIVVAAELRHCEKQASKYISDYYTAGRSRDEVYADCSVYNANDILKAGVYLFDTDRLDWNRSYGGDKWKQIAKAGLMKGKVSDCVFIDHCVDLSHNNSVYFDKHAGIFFLPNSNSYKLFLDLKCSCEPRILIKEKQGGRFNRLLGRANVLSIIRAQPEDSGNTPARDEAESLLFSYTPMKWGDERLDISESNVAINIGFRSDTNRREEDDEYERCA